MFFLGFFSLIGLISYAFGWFGLAALALNSYARLCMKKRRQCDANLVHRAARGRYRGGVIKPQKGKGAYNRHDKSWRAPDAA